MAGIVQADPYTDLFRQIGYSVGGEYLLRNTLLLTDLYSKEGVLTWPLWNDLVENVIGRKVDKKPGKKNAAEHMADMYSSLNLLNVMANQIFPGPALEALSILKRSLLHNDSALELAAKAVLCKEILESDGDIFTNCLAGQFIPKASSKLISSVINSKRSSISGAIKSPQILRRINSHISVSSFTPAKKINAPLSSHGWSSSPLSQRRLTPLDGLKPSSSEEVPESYVKKAGGLRKSWAKDLGFYEGDSITEMGSAFLDSLAHINLINKQGAYVIWPFERTLLELRINPESISVPRLTSWDFTRTVAHVFTGKKVTKISDVSNDDLFKLLCNILESYKTGSLTRGKIRHQLPINIAQLCLLGLAVGLNQGLPDWNVFMEVESKNDQRRINLANIRGTDGALEIKS